MSGCECGAELGWHRVACKAEMERQKAPKPPEGAADENRLRALAEHFDLTAHGLLVDGFPKLADGYTRDAKALRILADWLESLGGR